MTPSPRSVLLKSVLLGRSSSSGGSVLSASETSYSTSKEPATDEDDDGEEEGECPNNEIEELLSHAEHKFSQEKILDAYKLLQQVPDQSLLSEKHHDMCKTAKACEEAIADCLAEPLAEKGWKRQSESHGKRNTVIYYKGPPKDTHGNDEHAQHLICRVETEIEQDLLLPLLSVFNESDLYGEWMPRWRMPRMGLREAVKLGTHGMLNQTVRVMGDAPWPFADREAVLRSVVVDDIDSNGFFAVRIHTVDESGGVVPPPNPKAERIEFEGALLFRPLLEDKPGAEPKILVIFKMWCDPKMSLPTSLLNFITRTAIGTVWGMLLAVAEDVRAGKRQTHKDAIASKPEFYAYIQQRVGCMFQRMSDEQENVQENNRFILYLQS